MFLEQDWRGNWRYQSPVSWVTRIQLGRVAMQRWAVEVFLRCLSRDPSSITAERASESQGEQIVVF